jgi:hypothetical protein
MALSLLVFALLLVVLLPYSWLCFRLGCWCMRREMLRSGVYWPLDYERLRQSVEDQRNGVRGRAAQEVFEELRTRQRPEGKV